MKDKISFKQMIMNKFSLTSIVLFLLGETISVVLLSENKLNQIVLQILNCKIRFGVVLTVLLLIMLLVCLTISYIRLLKVKYKEALLKNNTLSNNIKEKEDFQSNLIKELSNDTIKHDPGTNLFNLAMALDTFEPSKFILLEKALHEGNYYAGIYLGNVYQSGLKKGDAIIIQKDNQKAFSFYEAASKKDPYGIALWRMGWSYERGQVGTAMEKENREKTALSFYKQSRNLQYGKAYNSIGKFYNKGLGGLNKNQFAAIEQYGKAEELYDHFATLNKAMILSKMGNLDEAEKSFRKAISTNSPGAYTAFASFIQANRDHFKKYSDEQILELYCQAALIKNSNVAARAFYKIADFVCEHPDVTNIESISQALFETNEEDFILSCRLKAYEILYNNLKAGIRFTPKDMDFCMKIAKTIGNDM